jgi:hypothetical protein
MMIVTTGKIAPMEEGSGLKPIFGKKAERDSRLGELGLSTPPFGGKISFKDNAIA